MRAPIITEDTLIRLYIWTKYEASSDQDELDVIETLALQTIETLLSKHYNSSYPLIKLLEYYTRVSESAMFLHLDIDNLPKDIDPQQAINMMLLETFAERLNYVYDLLSYQQEEIDAFWDAFLPAAHNMQKLNKKGKEILMGDLIAEMHRLGVRFTDEA